MIGQHPELAGLPELKLFCYATIGELEASLPAFWLKRGVTHRSPGLVRAVAQLAYGDQSIGSLAAAHAWLRIRSHWSGPDVLDFLMARLGGRTAVEKSPEDVDADEALQRLHDAYPKARYLHLTRHPITTLHSMQRHWVRTMMPDPLAGEPIGSSAIAAWFQVNERIRLFCARLPKDRWMRARAEDLLNDPNRHLLGVATWLGIRTDDAAIAAMQHPEASIFARFGPVGSGVVGGSDPDFLADPTLRRTQLPTSLQSPKCTAAYASLWRAVIDLSARLGYA